MIEDAKEERFWRLVRELREEGVSVRTFASPYREMERSDIEFVKVDPTPRKKDEERVEAISKAVPVATGFPIPIREGTGRTPPTDTKFWMQVLAQMRKNNGNPKMEFSRINGIAAIKAYREVFDARGESASLRDSKDSWDEYAKVNKI